MLRARANGETFVSATMCALLPGPVRTMSASLARANGRVHLHNERNFPQPKLDSELNVRFLLNKYGNLYCLLLNNSLHVIFFNLKIFQKETIGRKTDIGESVHKTVTLGCKL